MDKSLYNSDKYEFSVCFEGGIFGGKDKNTSHWLEPSYAWIKSLYLVSILFMTMFCSNLHVFLSHLECSFLFVQSTSHFLSLLYNLYLLISNL
jgi:hypothetical protein